MLARIITDIKDRFLKKPENMANAIKVEEIRPTERATTRGTVCGR